MKSSTLTAVGHNECPELRDLKLLHEVVAGAGHVCHLMTATCEEGPAFSGPLPVEADEDAKDCAFSDDWLVRDHAFMQEEGTLKIEECDSL